MVLFRASMQNGGGFIDVSTTLLALGVTTTFSRYSLSGTLATVANTTLHGCTFACGTTSTTIVFEIRNPQFEIGAFASTYIPTTGIPVTRAADICTWTVGSALSSGPGTLFAARAVYGSVAQQRCYQDTSNYTNFTIEWSNGSFNTYLSSAAPFTSAMSPTLGKPFTSAWTWGAGRAAYLNGALIKSDQGSNIASGAVGTVGAAPGTGNEVFDYILPVYFSTSRSAYEIANLDASTYVAP